MDLLRNPLDLLLVVLAAGQVLHTWLTAGLFASWRARIEVYENRLSELLMCPVCLSHHVPYLLILLVLGSFYLASSWIGYGVVYSLAVTRLVILLNGILPDHLRYDADPELQTYENLEEQGSLPYEHNA